MDEALDGRTSEPRREHLRVDVTDAVGTGETLSVAATVVLPRGVRAATVLVGFPGGGYSRHYYDLVVGADAPTGGYSQARHHTAAGSVFVAVDHLGVGDSDVPTQPVDYDAVARANTRATTEIVSRLRNGTLAADLPAIEVPTVIGMGQSFGGFLLTLAQAADPVFDGVAFLGWSAVRTDPGWPKDADVESIVRNGTRGDDPANPRRRVYHWPDVPDEIVIADLTREPGVAGSKQMWGAASHPGGPAIIRNRNPVEAGVVSVEAASMSVPVFIGAGEIDVMPDPWAEPVAYRASRDVTVCVFERMGHMHNFASSRAQLWARLSSWVDGIGGRVSH